MATFFLLGAGVGLHGEDAEKQVMEWTTTVVSEAHSATAPYLAWIEHQLEQLVHREYFRDAANLQQGAMCRIAPLPAGVCAHAVTRPGQRVSGDVIHSARAGDTVWFAVGDVTGHGTAAAAYGGQILHLLHFVRQQAELQTAEHPLLAAAIALNREILEHKVDIVALPIIFSRVDPKARRIEVLNCGSVAPPLLLQNGRALEIDGGGPPLGYVRNPPFRLWERPWTEGDVLVLPTDGIVEQHNAHGEQYSNQRLAELLPTIENRDPVHVVRQVFQALDHFAQGTRRGDDQSLLVIRLG